MLSDAHNATLEEPTARYRSVLGTDEAAYLGHVHRVLHFCEKLRDRSLDQLDVIAAFFHDLGIWTDRTNDYLPPSVREAHAFLEKTGRAGLPRAELRRTFAEYPLRPFPIFKL